MSKHDGIYNQPIALYASTSQLGTSSVQPTTQCLVHGLTVFMWQSIYTYVACVDCFGDIILYIKSFMRGSQYDYQTCTSIE